MWHGSLYVQKSQGFLDPDGKIWLDNIVL